MKETKMNNLGEVAGKMVGYSFLDEILNLLDIYS